MYRKSFYTRFKHCYKTYQFSDVLILKEDIKQLNRDKCERDCVDETSHFNNDIISQSHDVVDNDKSGVYILYNTILTELSCYFFNKIKFEL